MCVSTDWAEFELSVDEPEEFLVDDPDEVPWLAELLNSAPVSAPLVMRSSRWAGSSQSQTPHNMDDRKMLMIEQLNVFCSSSAVTMEMKQVSGLSDPS